MDLVSRHRFSSDACVDVLRAAQKYKEKNSPHNAGCFRNLPCAYLTKASCEVPAFCGVLMVTHR